MIVSLHGAALTNLGVVTSNNSAATGTGFTDFSDLTFSNSTITARGAMIYNTTPSANSNANTTLTNAAVAVLDFGSDKVSNAGDFTIIFPTATNTTAIIRIA
jgi:type V secretory pathway adhesin AidA